MKYIVYFLYNGRGKMAVEHVVHCELPENIGPEHLRNGFWIDDGEDIWKHGAKFVLTGGVMWVPPGRITSVLRA